MSYLDRVKQIRNKKLSILKEDFRKEAKRLVNLLLSKGYGCKKIYLYGSAIKDRPFAPWSDIDLAIEGLKDEKFLEVYALFLKNSRFPVDLKPFEDLDAASKEKIKREGEVIYEKR